MEIEAFSKIQEGYSASSLGFIRNDKTGKMLKGRKNGRGYLQIQINGKNRSVHRLVLEAFFGNDNRHVNHKDGNKENNNLSNLEFVTISQNALHAFENGLRKSNLTGWNKKQCHGKT